MGDNDFGMRDDMRDLQRRVGLLEANMAVVLDFVAETRARNRALPGWLLTGLGLLLPVMGALATAWAAGKVP